MLRKHSKQALALLLTLTMLLSCMVWSGVSAASEYSTDFTGYTLNSSANPHDVDGANGSVAGVADTGEADYGQAMKLEYKTGANGYNAGFRFFGGTGSGKVQYDQNAPQSYFFVQFEYKVVSLVGSGVTLKVACGSKSWGGDDFNNVPNYYDVETLTATTEWKTARLVVTNDPTANSAVHIFLNAGSVTNAGNVAGTAVWVDNVKVIKDYVPPKAVLDLGYDSLTTEQIGATGNPVDLTAPSRSGYNFLGWYDESDNPVTAATFGESGTTVTYVAKWEAVTDVSTLKFVTNGGIFMQDMLGTPGNAAVVADPTKAGSKFTGWYSDSACTNKVTTITYPANQGDVVTLYAGWQAIDYVVAYSHFDTLPVKNADGSDGAKPAGFKSDGSASGDNSHNVIYDADNGYMKFALNGKNAKGNDSSTFGFRVYGNRWQTYIDGTKVIGSDGDASRAKKDMPYRVSFKYKVNTLTVPAAINVRNGDVYIGREDAGKANYKGGNDDTALVGSVALAPVTEAGEWQTAHVDFVAVDDAAWQVGVAISQPTDEPCEILIDDVVVEWLPDSRRVNLVMDYNDGVTANGTLAQVAGDTVTLPTPVSARPGYAFDGWLDEAGNPVEGAITVPGYNAIYTAQWAEDASQTGVIFNVNGGDAIADMYGVAGSSFELPTPTRGVYIFDGWYADEQLTEKVEAGVYPAEGAVTLYAKWLDPVDASVNVQPHSEYLGEMTFETGTKGDYLLKTNRVNLTSDKNHTVGGSVAANTHLVQGVNAQRDRFRLVLQPGNMATARPLEVKAGEGYTIGFWVNFAKRVTNLTFYAATLGASDVNTQINAGSGSIHTQQVLDYYAVGTTVNGNFSAKEPDQLVVEAGQWTYVVMHIPSIVLDDAADINYLSIGITDKDAVPESAYTTNEMYVDDIKIWRDLAPTGNLIASMDFEDSAIGDYIYQTLPGASGSTMSIANEKGRGNSLKGSLVGPFNSQRNRIRIVLEKDGAPLVVEAGKSYTVSFWIRSDAKDFGTLAFYAATMGKSDVNTQILASSGACHTLQKLSYANTGVPMANGGSSTWGNALETSSGWTSKAYWTQVVMTLPAVTLDATGEDNYLALGVTYGVTATGERADVYVDDIKVYDNTLTDGMELLDSINTVEQYVGGGKGKLPEGAVATEGSAVYDDNGTAKTAFRVSATYKVGEDFNQITLGGKVYDVVERGILLGNATKLLTNGATLALGTTAAQGLAGKVSASTNLDKYWRYDEETGTVTYSALVRGITKELKDTRFVARSYMKILVDGEEVVLYSKVSRSFTAQEIYDAACNLTETAYGWFE